MNFVFVYKSKERQNQRIMWSLPGWDSSQKCRCLVEHEAHLQPTMNLPFGEQDEGWKEKKEKDRDLDREMHAYSYREEGCEIVTEWWEKVRQGQRSGWRAVGSMANNFSLGRSYGRTHFYLVK